MIFCMFKSVPYSVLNNLSVQFKEGDHKIIEIYEQAKFGLHTYFYRKIIFIVP